MRKIASILLAVSATFYIACDDGSNDDPSTKDRGEFNPAGNLQTLTGDGSITLTWVGANAEEDFQGYHVFGTVGKVADIANATLSNVFPSGTDITKSASIPRCKDNSSFFETFGFPSTDAECESSTFGDEESSTTSTSTSSNTSTSPVLSLQEDTEEDLTIDFNLACLDSDGNALSSDGSISYPATDGKTLGRVFCKIDKVYDSTDGTASLVNGTTYTFFVVAVKGSEKNEISWVSNVVQDTPAHILYQASVEIETDKFKRFPIDVTDFTDTEPVDGSCSGNFCTVTGTNSEAEDGVYVGRDTGTSYEQRLLLSTSTNGSIQLQPRGPEVWLDDSREGQIKYQKPGDQSVTTFQSTGKVFAVYGQQVFDMKITSGSDIHYGKFVVNDISYADDSDNESSSTLVITIVAQPAVEVVDYFTQPVF